MSQHSGGSYGTPPPPPGEHDSARTLRFALVVACAVVLAAAAAIGIAVAIRPHKSSPSGAATTSPDANDAMSLDGWNQFGGIDAHPNGDTVVLDTHNTTENWTTKWSGLIAPTQVACTLHVSTRVRDISHTAGIAGGYGIGLATTKEDPPGQVVLTGTAIQYDFGQQGYRTAIYPDDGAFGLAPAALDHDWHTIEVNFDAQGVATESVDGKEMVHQQIDKVCGRPVIRVWAGAVEFGDISISSSRV